MNKRLLFIVLAFMTMVTSAWAEDYYLWIDNTQVNTANCSDIMGDGGFRYVPSENTLYVRGGLTSDISCIWAYIENLTIVVEKDVTLRCTGSYKHAINIYAKTKITGGGKLTVISEDHAINVDTNIALTIEDADMTLSGSSGISCLNSHVGTQNLTIRNSNLQIYSTSGAICGFGGGITLEDCYITAPYGAWIKGKDIVDKNNDIALNVTISQNLLSGVAIDEINFPDPIFRWYVKDFCQYDGDDFLTDEEIEELTTMYCINYESEPIYDLTGIEHFTELQNLACCFNQLTSLDVSQNKKLKVLTCNNNKIKGTEMDNLIASLPSTGGKFEVIAPFDPNEGNEITAKQMARAINKNWTVYYWSGEDPFSGDWLEYTGSFIVPTAISSVKSDADNGSPSYNLQGQRVGNGFKGIVVVNGKKVLRK